MPKVQVNAPDGPLRITHGDGTVDEFTVKNGEITVGEARMERVVGALGVEAVTTQAARTAARAAEDS